ncbi:MAG: hypothetical protein R3191_04475, partial [Anaerolineales bacterium]|nr:hypothetical protein [Anaerolineales bacterium]
PFREAHEVVGRAVRRAEETDTPLDELGPSELQAVDERFEADAADVFDVDRSLQRRRAIGGTAPERLQQQLAELRDELALWRERLETAVSSEPE